VTDSHAVVKGTERASDVSVTSTPGWLLTRRTSASSLSSRRQECVVAELFNSAIACRARPSHESGTDNVNTGSGVLDGTAAGSGDGDGCKVGDALGAGVGAAESGGGAAGGVREGVGGSSVGESSTATARAEPACCASSAPGAQQDRSMLRSKKRMGLRRSPFIARVP
jgi:hypothetical protein